MEYLYKVEFISSPRVSPKKYSAVDGLTLAKELEALILEYVTRGYELVETRGINHNYPGIGTDTGGLIVIFKKKGKQ